jgi:hypothetical protein
VSGQPGNFPARADHDLGVEGKPARDLVAQLRAADGASDHERTGAANVDGVEVPQL